MFKKLKDKLFKVKEENGYRRIFVFGIRVWKKYTEDEIVTLPHPNCHQYGRHTYVAFGDAHIEHAGTTIGSFCSIGQRVVLGHGEHPTNFLSSSPYFYFNKLGFKKKEANVHLEFWNVAPIHIGNDVWIGDGAFVKNGITIGDGAIIAARAVVTKDVPPYAIVGGVPAKVIRYRFDEETIKELLRLKWWDLDDDIIREIPYDDINKALEFLRSIKK